MTRLPMANGSGDVSIGKVLCLLGNYSKHVEEMGSEVPEEIHYFLKPTSSIIRNGGQVIIPRMSGDVHHEVELAVVIGKAGKDISPGEALEHVLGYSVFLDITARDIQSRCKREGRPWSIPKGFDTFAPMSDIASPDQVGETSDLRITLDLNRERKQDSSTRYMIRSVAEIISYCSRIVTLFHGDVIATGTPEGVGRIQDGDSIVASIERVGTLEISVQDE